MTINPEFAPDFANFTDGFGTLPGVLDAAPVTRPMSSVAYDDWLVYTLAEDSSPQKHTAGALLNRFIRLQGRSASEIAAFAKREGVLELCEEHGVPRHHGYTRKSIRRPGSGACPLSHEEELGGYLTAREPLELWRRYSRRAGGLIYISALLAIGESVPGQLWQDSALAEIDYASPAAKGAEIQQQLIASAINRWCSLGRLRIRIEWNDGAPETRFWSPGLFGRVGLALVQAVGRTGGLAHCSHCNLLYLPSRKPPNAFCCSAVMSWSRNTTAEYSRKARWISARTASPSGSRVAGTARNCLRGRDGPTLKRARLRRESVSCRVASIANPLEGSRARDG